ncbi:hypothetical protein PDJAM_G00117890 [Pangasius djambal]|uniref:Uncharacterized protein n=1 Tax=Pangasius djambal TaxID=1691987 RepID=A0ACC5ZB59_9TELE|nr:hypothetical protein [Pangasius djambal]
MSICSCPPRTSFPSDLEEGEEGVFDVGDCKTSPIKLEKKKARRRYTNDPSKECFTLKFDLNVDIGMEIVQAVKKKTLREVLGTVFEKKGIELSQVDLFLDQSSTPLSLGFEAYRFGGHYLRVQARPGGQLRVEKGVKDPRSLSLPIIRPSSARSASFDRVEHGSLGRREAADLRGQARRRKNMTEFPGDTNISLDSVSQLSGSLTNTNTGTDRWKNRAASRFSVFFTSSLSNGSVSKECECVEQLQSKLHSYTLFGLPKMPQQLSFHRDSWEEQPNLEMEESWKELLEKPELFLCGLLNLQESGLLCDIDPARLFGNIQEIVHLHTLFWVEVLLPTLERSRHSHTMLNPLDLHQGFSTFDYRFKPYIHYCLEEESCMEYMRILLKDNELFRIYVTWAETHKQCSRLKLTDMLVKPHQRLTKYPLLLKSILKKTDEQVAQEALTRMVTAVEGFINNVDSQMRQQEEKQKLAAIASRIEAYEPVEGAAEEVEKILKDYNQFDLTAPVLGASAEETRQLYLEGALKMKEGKDSKMDVHCFLFTDMLLITKPVKRVEKVKVIRQPLIIRNIVCKDLKDPGAFLLIYLNEFRSAVASYCFQASGATQGCSWVEAIYNAQNQLKRLCSVSRGNERDEEEENEMESSISMSSSPSLQHKEPLHKRSTETVSVVSLEVPNKVKKPLLLDSVQASLQSPLYSDAPGTRDTLSINDNRALERLDDLVAMKLDPESRSLSIDSAYGTLSPESLIAELDLKGGMEQSEGEGTDTGEEEEAFEEDDGADVDDDGNEENSIAWNGSQVTVNESNFTGDHYNLQEEQMEHLHLMPLYNNASRDCRSLTLRRRSSIHPRTGYLQNFARRSCSEDNLLQQLTSPVHHSRNSNHNISKSLTQLMDSSEHLQAEQGQSHHNPNALSDKVTDTLMRAEVRIFHRSMSCLSDQNVRKCDMVASQQLQKRKLTKAQLQKMRTTMMLNSTLTASEV